jgi:hypothetical protein
MSLLLAHALIGQVLVIISGIQFGSMLGATCWQSIVSFYITDDIKQIIKKYEDYGSISYKHLEMKKYVNYLEDLK